MRDGSKGATTGLVIVAALAGGLMGAAAMRVAADAQGRPSESVSAPDELAREMRDLAAEITSLREALSRTPQREASARGDDAAPEPAPLASHPDLLNTLERLAIAIADLARSGGSAAQLRVPAPDPKLKERAAVLMDDATALSAHFLWSCQQLLDAYGRPSNVTVDANGTESWVYDFNDRGFLFFTVHDGRVVSFWPAKKR